MTKSSVLMLMCLILWVGTIHAVRIVVAADGSADATTIQAGVNMAAVSDSVIIAHGIWTGIVVIDNKAITIGSYYIVDGDTTHISQTIVDGEDTRTGIIIKNCSAGLDTLKVVGLTIRNCRSNSYPLSGDYSSGGGISLMQSVAVVSNCTIHHCRAYYGGGISAIYSTVHLKSNEIYRNVAIYAGGGVSAIKQGTGIYFDEEQLNSIFLNYGVTGCDILYAVNCNPTIIYLDRGSVISNDSYFYYCLSQPPIYVNYAMITQVDHDLWVSPFGDNANDGQSPQSPLKNISYALAKIQANANASRTVHVMPGTYSWTQTGEALPLQPKSYVNLIGTDMDSVILDAEEYGMFIIGDRAQDYLTIKNFTLVNGHTKHQYLFCLTDIVNGTTEQITVENIHIKDSWVKSDAFRIMSCHNLTVNNLTIEDSQVGNGFLIYCYETANLSNFRVQRLTSTNYDMYNSSCTGGGIAKPLSAAALQTTINISNFLITDIVDTSQFWQNIASGFAVNIEGGNCDLKISNCTFANNSSVTQSGGLNFSLENCNAQVYNTIVSGNSPYEVLLHAYNESTFADVSFNNCLITGGDSSFYLMSGVISHTWEDGNIFDLPSFIGGDNLNPMYYSLSENSPCIDSGTPDASALNLPPYDLAGNWRVWNNRIDMGCYESGSEPWVSNDDPELAPAPVSNLSAYPNPFRSFTNLKVNLDATMRTPTIIDASISIYNLKGQRVKSISLDPGKTGEQFTYWDGRDNSGTACASGIYFLNLMVNGKQVSNRKVSLIK